MNKQFQDALATMNWLSMNVNNNRKNNTYFLFSFSVILIRVETIKGIRATTQRPRAFLFVHVKSSKTTWLVIKSDQSIRVVLVHCSSDMCYSLKSR